jgi:hypothetical protein
MERSLSLSLAHSSLDTLWSSPVCCQEYLPSSKEFCEQMDFKVMTKENSAITIVHEKKQLTSLQKHPANKSKLRIFCLAGTLFLGHYLYEDNNAIG